MGVFIGGIIAGVVIIFLGVILAKSKNYGKDLEEYSLETVRGFFKDASGLGFSIL